MRLGERLAIRLGVRPFAARLYWLWQDFKKASRTLRYKLFRAHSDSYRVTITDAHADFSVLTEQEYYDFVRLPEQPILEELLSELQPDDVFYDIGANLGLYSCLVADVVGQDIVAFEPHPRNADRLAKNASLNESDISIHRVALADSSGSTQLRLAPGFDLDRVGSAGHTLLTEYFDEESELVSVEKTRGDEIVARDNVPAPTVLKIDTEGTEMDVLEGLDSTLARSECRLVYCEIHEDRLNSQDHSPSDIRDFLEKRGFSVEEISLDGYQTYVCGRK